MRDLNICEPSRDNLVHVPYAYASSESSGESAQTFQSLRCLYAQSVDEDENSAIKM